MLRFTQSRDGYPRANLEVRFRVGIDAVELAATALVWKAMVEEDGAQHEGQDSMREEANSFAQHLTKAQIEASLRQNLHSNGMEMWPWDDDDYFSICREAAVERVRELWPAVYAMDTRNTPAA